MLGENRVLGVAALLHLDTAKLTIKDCMHRRLTSSIPSTLAAMRVPVAGLFRYKR